MESIDGEATEESVTNDFEPLTKNERVDLLRALDEYTDQLLTYQCPFYSGNTCTMKIGYDGIFHGDKCAFRWNSRSEDSFDKVAINYDATASPEGLEENAAYEKASGDSGYELRVIEKLKEEIRERGSHCVLKKEIKSILARENEKEALFEESERSKRVVEDLEAAIEEEKAKNERQKGQLIRGRIKEQDEKKRMEIMEEIGGRYATAWERADCELNDLREQMRMEEMEHALRERSLRERNDRRLENELMVFYAERSASMEKEAKEWRERYDREKELYDREIRKVRNEIEIRRKILEVLGEEYRRKQEFVDSYQAEKEALRKQKQEEEHARASVIRIQAWWRGVMVRRKLGPYRPEDRKKKRPVKGKK